MIAEGGRAMAQSVEIFEMGPRDGLQNEKRAIPVAEKIALVDCLSRAGSQLHLRPPGAHGIGCGRAGY